MIFNYDPITGLQYTSPNHIEICIYGIPQLPGKSMQELIDEWRECIRELGFALVDSTTPAVGQFSPIISNVPYFE